MHPAELAGRDRITIAILALGGQGGGVLADWILEVANANGFTAQRTSVPGVAQRTGSTVYYIEMVRRGTAGANQPAPVMAMMPVPGDVDIVLASELMEAGRAVLRGFVTTDRTVLIGSTHRIYAISEKSALGNGIAASQRIIDAAHRNAARFIGFDMDDVATTSGSLISSVLLGALAGSQALPFTRTMFEDAIRHGGKAVAANLKGFAAGAEQAETPQTATDEAEPLPQPTSPAGMAFRARISAELPMEASDLAIHGVRKLMDYQDAAYASLYLDRLGEVASLDSGGDNWRLTRETARHLAVWMAYEDTIRVADLKVRATRIDRIEREVQLKPEQLLAVTEYMHPRLREVCETMPAWLGSAIWGQPTLRRWLEPAFAKGRHVETTSLGWFLLLRVLASLRRIRRSTLRYVEEQQRIEAWLAAIREAAATDNALAAELAATQRLIKGYSDTFERSLSRFQAVMAAASQLRGQPDASDRVRRLRDAALEDEDGTALSKALAA